jgi:hypothetical protein
MQTFSSTGQAAKQLVDLERARDAALDAPRLGERRHVLALEQHPSARGRQQSCQQVHERGLARAIRPDQRVPRAALEPEVDLARDFQGAEILAKRLCLEHGRRTHRAPSRRERCRTFSTSPRMPLRA